MSTEQKVSKFELKLDWAEMGAETTFCLSQKLFETTPVFAESIQLRLLRFKNIFPSVSLIFFSLERERLFARLQGCKTLLKMTSMDRFVTQIYVNAAIRYWLAYQKYDIVSQRNSLTYFNHTKRLSFCIFMTICSQLPVQYFCLLNVFLVNYFCKNYLILTAFTGFREL